MLKRMKNVDTFDELLVDFEGVLGVFQGAFGVAQQNTTAAATDQRVLVARLQLKCLQYFIQFVNFILVFHS